MPCGLRSAISWMTSSAPASMTMSRCSEREQSEGRAGGVSSRLSLSKLNYPRMRDMAQILFTQRGKGESFDDWRRRERNAHIRDWIYRKKLDRTCRKKGGR